MNTRTEAWPSSHSRLHGEGTCTGSVWVELFNCCPHENTLTTAERCASRRFNSSVEKTLMPARLDNSVEELDGLACCAKVHL